MDYTVLSWGEQNEAYRTRIRQLEQELFAARLNNEELSALKDAGFNSGDNDLESALAQQVEVIGALAIRLNVVRSMYEQLISTKPAKA